MTRKPVSVTKWRARAILVISKWLMRLSTVCIVLGIAYGAVFALLAKKLHLVALRNLR